MVKDLRTQCRFRGLNPGGSTQALRDRIKDHMLGTGDFSIVSDVGPEGGTSMYVRVDECHGEWPTLQVICHVYPL